jgi:hypothetical protein
MHTTRYMIIDGDRVHDGDIYTKEQLFDAILYAEYEAEIVSFDLEEVLSKSGTGSTPMRLCTEDLVTEWWSGDGSRDVWERVVAGKSIGLASRFYSDEIAQWEARVA